MSVEQLKNLNTGQEDNVCTVDHIALQIKALEKFMARRFDEISMEINAATQLLGMAEDGIGERFSVPTDVTGTSIR